VGKISDASVWMTACVLLLLLFRIHYQSGWVPYAHFKATHFPTIWRSHTCLHKRGCQIWSIQGMLYSP